ncbi:hypothetical protein CNY67_01850 [Desulfovibrio sp. G11]|nr:hypothetical protein CNY67_01850 [Desulfovibrio sp. G11]
MPSRRAGLWASCGRAGGCAGNAAYVAGGANVAVPTNAGEWEEGVLRGYSGSRRVRQIVRGWLIRLFGGQDMAGAWGLLAA